MSKTNEALAKLEKECEEDINDNNIVLISNHLRVIVSGSEAAAEKVLANGKTIKGAVEAMYNVAKDRHKKGNMVLISPDEGFNIINKYYGFGGSVKTEIIPAVAAPPDKDDKVVSLLDLMI